LQSTLQELISVPPFEQISTPPSIGSMPPVVPAELEAPAPVPVEAAAPEPVSAPVPVAVPVPNDAYLDELGSSMASLATQVWRARSRIIDPATGEPREEMRRVHRHVEGAFESLAEMGLVINDWMNQPYDSGLPVKVLTFQPASDVQRDTVLEATRPTVIWKERLLQMGEVIVGIPQSTEAPPPSP
jgi:hypothetical protein